MRSRAGRSHSRTAVAAVVEIGLEREREVHGLARGSGETPVSRQTGDQHQAPSGSASAGASTGTGAGHDVSCTTQSS